MEGKVKWFNRVKGYGFIEGGDGEDYFIHHSQLEGINFVREDDVVSFEAVETDKGMQAQNVKLLKKGSEASEEAAEEPKEEFGEEPKEEPKEDFGEEPKTEPTEDFGEEESKEEPAKEKKESKEE